MTGPGPNVRTTDSFFVLHQQEVMKRTRYENRGELIPVEERTCFVRKENLRTSSRQEIILRKNTQFKNLQNMFG